MKTFYYTVDTESVTGETHSVYIVSCKENENLYNKVNRLSGPDIIFAVTPHKTRKDAERRANIITRYYVEKEVNRYFGGRAE